MLGLTDAYYDSLSYELKSSLTDCYRVQDMHNYDELVRALGYFTHRFGKLNCIDSHNEYWLETEAKLRTDFNIPGVKLEQIGQIKRKSEMKEVFRQAGLKPARGQVCRSEEEIRGFVKEVGYPVVAKPDSGVGAAATYKIANENELVQYLKEKPQCDYIVEEFIAAQIVSFDGLTDPDGKLVFSTSLRYSKGVMEAVNEDSDIYYYLVRDIEPALEDAGLRTLRAFDVRARFFHFEYFLTKQGEVIPLEVNMRPPGGLTLDMMNYCFDFDCYRTWAEMVVLGQASKPAERKYFVMYVGRKDHINYAIPHHEIFDRFRSVLVHDERMSGVFARAIGNHGYILRHDRLEPLIESAEAILQRR